MRRNFALFAWLICTIAAANAEEDLISREDLAYAQAMSIAHRILHDTYPPIDIEKCRKPLVEGLLRLARMPGRASYVYDPKEESARSVKIEEAKKLTRELREIGCLDRYSHLYESSWDRTASRTCDAKDVERAKDKTAISRVRIWKNNDALVIEAPTFVWLQQVCTERTRLFKHTMVELIAKINRHTFSRVIVDFRENRGGYRDVAERFVSDLFSPHVGAPLTTLCGHSGCTDTTSTDVIGTLPCPHAVLISERSASGAEMAGGIIRKWCPKPKTHFVGTTTYGKGTRVTEVPGVGVRATYSDREFFIGNPPDLVKIEGVGIVPDILVAGERKPRPELVEMLLDPKRRRHRASMTPRDFFIDPVMDAALATRR